MATLTISYDGRNKAARSVVEILRSLDFFSITETPAKPKRKSGIELAYEDVAAGRVTASTICFDMLCRNACNPLIITPIHIYTIKTGEELNMTTIACRTLWRAAGFFFVPPKK